MKKILVILMICYMCTACGTKEETKVDVPEQAEEIVEEVAEETEAEVEVVETEVVQANVISPLLSINWTSPRE